MSSLASLHRGYFVSLLLSLQGKDPLPSEGLIRENLEQKDFIIEDIKLRLHRHQIPSKGEMVEDSVPSQQRCLSQRGIRPFYMVRNNKLLAAGIFYKWEESSTAKEMCWGPAGEFRRCTACPSPLRCEMSKALPGDWSLRDPSLCFPDLHNHLLNLPST